VSAPIVYRWDDANAPVARGERGSLIEILTACLVTGYGEKAAAGWTREFANAELTKAAFRNDAASGTGFFLQVDELSSADAHTPYVQGYEAMTSENDGLFPFNSTRQQARTSSTDGTTARPWVLIADDRAFYFICWTTITATPTNSNYSVSAIFFGDAVSRYQVDDYCCALQSYINDGSYGKISSYASAASGTLNSTAMAMPRNAAGTQSPILPVLVTGGGPCGAGSVFFDPGCNGPSYTAGGPLFVSRPFINEAVAYSFPGWLPGFYYPCHPNAFTQLLTVVVDGKSFLSLQHRVGNGSVVANYFLSLDDWRA